MKIDIMTLFPGMFAGPFDESIIKRAREKGLVEINITDFRDFSESKHRVVDDAPFGGGHGMVLKPEPLFAAVEDVEKKAGRKPDKIVLLTPQGQPFTQETAVELSKCNHVVLICGHYEGFDERVRQYLATDEISLGDFVLTGGELPAMIVVDAVVRLVPGVLGEEESAHEDSFSGGLLEYPHYTRPRDFRGWTAPEVLLNGHHEEIRRWRRMMSLKRTLERRPELLEKAGLTEEDKNLLAEARELLQREHLIEEAGGNKEKSGGNKDETGGHNVE